MGNAPIDAFIAALDEEAGRLDEEFRTTLPETLNRMAAQPDRLARLVSLMKRELRQYETLAGQAGRRMAAALRRSEDAVRASDDEAARRALDEHRLAHADAARHDDDAKALREILEAYEATSIRARQGRESS